MMRNLGWMWLALLVLVGCGDQVTKDEVTKDEVLEKEIVWENDGKEMVLIPAGSFEMGDHDGEMSVALPVHTVELDAFYMDVHEVTVGQFRKFVAQSGYEYNADVIHGDIWKDGDEHPVMGVDWNDAAAYAKWAGKRLPTEAEWEYAARGGLAGKRYSWGDERGTAERANCDDNAGGTTVVGRYPANGYGLYDMAGNVWEWCQDWFDKDYYNNSPTKNPSGPDTGEYRVLRGGDWDADAYSLRVAVRSGSYPGNRSNAIGFRCVSGLP